MLTMSFVIAVCITVDPVSSVQFTTEIVKLAYWGVNLYLVAKQINDGSKKNER